MTVQELIDELQKLGQKNLNIVWMDNEYGETLIQEVYYESSKHAVAPYYILQ